jgi:hypothetical protein
LAGKKRDVVVAGSGNVLQDLGIRGIFNELQLSDLKKKTLRGQMGQKQRGFIAGEATFGYRSTPVGQYGWTRKADRGRMATR